VVAIPDYPLLHWLARFGRKFERYVRDESQTIGPYRTLRELGRGGQAIVWLAEDTRIQRQVALKVLPHLGPGGEEALKRFRREAEVASRLDHPGICALLEADLDRGVPYIAMRYVPGETLAKRLSNARAASELPPDRAALRELARVFEKCARALHVAHESGVIHRDVKPANIMLTPDDEPVILDFGLARHDDHAAQQMSVSGEVSGTPAYMSPEQMTGRARPDRRTDVWSLGIALHECATLQHPFEAATREVLLQAILSDDPPDPRRANPSIDRDLATILETSTAKDRDRRYQTALDLAEDLRRWRQNEPIRARPVSRFERAQRWVQRNPALAGSGAAIVVLLISAIALLAYGVGAADKVKVESQLRADADDAREHAESERLRADEARAALEQVQTDRRFAAELDDLSMQMGTFLYGLQDPKSAAAVLPGYLDAFRRFGIDLAHPESASSVPVRFAAFRERNPDLWTGVRESIGNLAWLLTSEHVQASDSMRAQIVAVLASMPRNPWSELDRAVRMWEEAKVDEFDALLTDEALETKGVDELSHLADALFAVDGRLPSVQRVLEYALRKDPGSFRFHFLAGSLGFISAFEAKQQDPQAFEARIAKILHHMQVAVTLRPRSGFMRAMLASALAMKGDYPESMRYIEEATELEPKNAVVWLFKARWYSYAQMWDRSMAACKTALELDPNLGGAREMLAEIELKAKK
jgi:tetratricopeptide (TPR) repeat protein